MLMYNIIKGAKMGLHETLIINGISIDFKKELPEESYVEVIRYLFTDSKTKPRSSFFYKKISENSYIKIFNDLKGNHAMLDFLKELFLLNEANLTKETKRELEFFFRFKNKDS